MPAVLRARRRLRPRRPAHPRREATATTGSSTARRSGPPARSIRDYGILITRTDPNVAKHKGLTMFFLDMKTPGRRGAADQAGQRPRPSFNEVYFTDVRIPDNQRLGAVGDGWNVSLTTLMNERMSIGAGMPTGFPELFDFCCELRHGGRPGDRRPRRALEARRVGRSSASGLKYTGMRAISALSKGETPGAGELDRQAGRGLDDAGSRDVRAGPAGPRRRAGRPGPGGERRPVPGDAAALAGTRIEGGTDEILRNIIAERVLGLPGDIRVDKDVPFNQIPANGVIGRGA